MAKNPKGEESKVPSPLMQRLGAEIHRRREYVGMSQTDVARLSGTDRLRLKRVVYCERYIPLGTFRWRPWASVRGLFTWVGSVV